MKICMWYFSCIFSKCEWFKFDSFFTRCLLTHACTLTAQTLICLSSSPLQPLTHIQYCHLVWLFHKFWTRSLWRRSRTHKNTAKCYNTGRSNFTPAFSIVLFTLESCQVSFTWNVCGNEPKIKVVHVCRWVGGVIDKCNGLRIKWNYIWWMDFGWTDGYIRPKLVYTIHKT